MIRAIQPSDVIEILRGVGVATGEEVREEVHCEGMPIARRSGSRVEVACAHAMHGVHPRYARAGLPTPQSDAPCPFCGGGGWLPVAGVAAQRQLALAIALGVFRGILLPTPSLTADHIDDMLVQLLSVLDLSAPRPSPSTAGVPPDEAPNKSEE